PVTGRGPEPYYFRRRARWSAIEGTCRDEPPLAITSASHRDERPSRSMVTIPSALSSSNEATIRFSRSLCVAGCAAFGAATFFAAFFGFGLAGADLLGAAFLA